MVVYGRLLLLANQLREFPATKLPERATWVHASAKQTPEGFAIQVYAEELLEYLAHPEDGEIIEVPLLPTEATDLLFRIVETFWGALPARPVSDSEAALLEESVALLKRSFGYYAT